MDYLAPQQPIEILLIEDNPGDARLTEELLRDGHIPTRINHVRDGVHALAFLRREGAYRRAPRPELILLDLNLPRLDGRELLAQIKRDSILRTIPVVILTGAAHDAYTKTLDAQADCVMPKPIDPEKLVTIVRAIEAQNSEATTSAAAAASAKVRLLANLAHELRTRLNPIIAFSEMMKLEIKGPLNNDYREYVRDIHDSALGLSRMVLDILDLAKVEMRRLSLTESRFPLRQAIEASVDAMREQARAAGINLSAAVPGSLPELNGDVHLIEEMVTGLLRKAVAHGRVGNSVQVSAGVAATGGLFVAVKDSRPGLVAAAPTHASAATGEDDGRGVGLSLCRSIAELHGGHLDIVSQSGGGATVTIHFPAARTETPKRNSAYETKPARSRTNSSVW